MLVERNTDGEVNTNLSYVLFTPEYDQILQTFKLKVIAHTQAMKNVKTNKVLGEGTPQYTDPSPPAPAALFIH